MDYSLTEAYKLTAWRLCFSVVRWAYCMAIMLRSVVRWAYCMAIMLLGRPVATVIGRVDR